MCTGLDVESILYQNTRFLSHLDHILVSNKLKLQAFATSFANLYTDHSSVTVRICQNGNFTSEFVEDQVIQFTQVKIDQFRPNMKHEFRRKKLDSKCSLFSPSRFQQQSNWWRLQKRQTLMSRQETTATPPINTVFQENFDESS